MYRCIYINIYFLLLIIITENVHIIDAYKIIAGLNGKKNKKKQEKVGHEKKEKLKRRARSGVELKTKIEVQ